MLVLYPYYFYKKNVLIKKAQLQLNAVADERLTKLDQYFEKYRKILEKLSGDKNTTEALHKMNEQFIKSDIKGENYLNLEASYKKYLNLILPNDTELNNLFLITPAGNVIFSRSKRAELGQNLLSGQYLNSSFNISLMRVLMTLAYDIEETNYYPITKGNAIFLLVPIFDNYRLLGIIAIEFGFKNLLELITNYDHLGATGEVIIATWKKEIVQYVSNVRHSMYSLMWSIENALKKNAISSFAKYAQGQEVEFIGDQSKILYEATLGNEIQGIEKDYRNETVFSTGRYYVDADWGLSVKMDLSEILHSLRFLQFFLDLLAVIGLILLILYTYIFCIALLNITKNYSSLLCAIFGTVLLFTGLLFIYIYNKTSRAVINNHLAEDKKNLEATRKQIELKLDSIKYFADDLASDINLNLISTHQYSKHIKRILQENSSIVAMSVAFKPNALYNSEPLTTYGVRTKDNKIVCCQPQISKQYTNPQEDSSISWYHSTIASGKSKWFNNYSEPITGKNVTVYAIPFKLPKSQQIAGVIAIMYSFDEIEDLVNGIYASLISKENRFLIDYTHNYINSEKNISELAVETDDPLIKNVNSLISSNLPMLEFYNSKNNRKEWVLLQNIPITGWRLQMQDSKDDMLFPVQQLQRYQILSAILIILALMLFASCLFLANRLKPFAYSLLLLIIQAIGLAGIFIIISKNLIALNSPEVPMEYQVYVTNFIKELNEDAYLKFKKPVIPIKTGIDITNIELKHKSASFTGFIWQRYPNGSDIKPQILFPQATKSTLTLIQTTKKENDNFVNWFASNELFQKDDPRHYPFDIRKVEISLIYPEIKSNVMFIPDLESYSNPSAESRIGIGNISNIDEFKVKRTYFDYKILQNTSDAEQIKPVLSFNILLQRALFNPFVVYIMPLLLILIALFTVIFAFERAVTPAVGLTWKSRFLAIVTAILLSLVMLHRNLRSDLHSEGIVYIEYLFFSIYITMSILALYIVFVEESVKFKINGQLIPLVTFLYWPLEIFTWLIMTIVVFY